MAVAIKKSLREGKTDKNNPFVRDYFVSLPKII